MIQKSGVSPVDVVDIPLFIGFLYILGPLGAGFLNHQQYHMFWRFWRSKLHPVTWFFSTFHLRFLFGWPRSQRIRCTQKMTKAGSKGFSVLGFSQVKFGQGSQRERISSSCKKKIRFKKDDATGNDATKSYQKAFKAFMSKVAYLTRP